MSTTRSGTFEVVVVCEGPSDHATVTLLADKVIESQEQWFHDDPNPETRNGVRRYRGLNEDRFLAWRDVKKHFANREGFGLMGLFEGKPGAPDAFTARRVLVAIRERTDCSAVMLIRDSDNERSREGLDQAAKANPWPFKVVIGFAVPKREAWILSCAPAGTSTTEGWKRVRTELGFDPVTKSHQINARTHGAKKDIKAVLERLLGGAHEAEWIESATIELLRERGENNGLTRFLDAWRLAWTEPRR